MLEAIANSEAKTVPLSVMLINMQGEFHLPLHEPIGIECIASKVLAEIPDTKLIIYDTQPEIMRTGRVDTTRLAKNIRDCADQSKEPFLLGISVPIYSWEYTKSLLIKLEDDYRPSVPITVVLGHAIPTYTDPKLIKQEFPYVKLVIGEGEEIFAETAKKVSRGKPIEDTLLFKPPDLTNYVTPLREVTKTVIDLGGSVKLEVSRGCDFGACTFCSRHLRGGKDYRNIPEEIVIKEVHKLTEEFNVTRFELTDEEAFTDIEATARLVSAWKSADLPHVHFVASLRVSTLLRLEEEGLLNQLQEIGLVKVFLGAEGGSDTYLKQLAKGQKVSQIEQAIEIAEQHGLDLELGFITFSWRMDFEMLKKSVEFLSQRHGHYAKYVPSLFNVLEVRAGTLEEVLLRRYVKTGKMQNYDPDEKFNVNFSCYQDVPFLDRRVEEAHRKVTEFVQKDKRVYGALKSLIRAESLSPRLHKQLEEFYSRFKDLYLQLLRHATGLETNENLGVERGKITEELRNLLEQEGENEFLDPLRRELEIFSSDTKERENIQSNQVEVVIVFLNERKKILLIRLRGEEKWILPSGIVQEDEEVVDAGIRVTKEKLGINDGFKIIGPLLTITKDGTRDQATEEEKHSVLHHYLASFDRQDIDIQCADYEIADTLWLSPQDILSNRVKTKPTIREFVETLLKAEKLAQEVNN